MRTILSIGGERKFGGRGAALAAALAVVVAACSSGTVVSAPDEGGVLVVATTSILGDVVASLAGSAAEVEVLIPPGADPHDYRPSARQVAQLRQADLVVANGLGLEESLADVLDAAVDDGARLIEVGPGVDPLPFGNGPCDPASGRLSGCDPHVWMDPLRMVEAVRLISAELAEVAPGVDWTSRAEGYIAELEAANGEITALLADIPEDRRVLVTNHDALGYFAARYRLEIVGTIIPGGSTLGAPSSAELAALVETIEARGVRAIFAENTQSTVLAEAVAAEAGRPVEVVELYTGSLGEPGSGAETLIGLLLTDARRIAGALR